MTERFEACDNWHPDTPSRFSTQKNGFRANGDTQHQADLPRMCAHQDGREPLERFARQGLRRDSTQLEGTPTVSLNRYAKKRDSAEPAIIQALESIGVHVWRLDEPCDLLLWRPEWGAGKFRMLEVKTGRGKRLTVARDKRQQAQQNFIASTGTPIVRTPLEALKAIEAFTQGVTP